MKKQKRVVMRRSREEWQKIIAEQEAVGESVPAYCRKHKLHIKSFYIWRKRLSSGSGRKPGGFIRIRTVESAESAKVLNIQTPGGYRLEVPEGTDGRYVQTILAGLR